MDEDFYFIFRAVAAPIHEVFSDNILRKIETLRFHHFLTI